MSSTNNVDKIMQQTQRYWYEDGFHDLGFGGFILAIGLLFLAQMLTPPGSPLWLVWGLASPLFLVGAALIVGKVVRRLKEQVTWPRTGYVSYRRERGASNVLRLLGVIVVSAGVSAAIVVVQKNWLSLTVIFGFVYMATLTYIALRFGLRRYLLLALWCMGLGLALAPWSLTLSQASAIYHIGIGSAWMLAGWLTWRQYDKRAPSAQEVTDERTG